MTPRHRKKKPSRIPRRAARHMLNIKWTFPAKDIAVRGGNKRYYKLETLKNATTGLLNHKDPFIVPSIHKVLGPPTVTSVNFDLFHENHYRFLFRLQAANAAKRRATLGFVVAKNHDEYSRLLKKEYGNLRSLHRRLPKDLVQPLLSGVVYLPDRHKRPGAGRTLFGYIVGHTAGLRVLGLSRGGQFNLQGDRPEQLSVADSEFIRRRIIEIMVRSFDPRTGSSLNVPDVVAGDIAVARPKSGPPRPVVIACRELLRRMTPAKLLHRIGGARWRDTGPEVPLLPKDPNDLAAALKTVLGRQEAGAWLSEYATAVESGRMRERSALPLTTLRSLSA